MQLRHLSLSLRSRQIHDLALRLHLLALVRAAVRVAEEVAPGRLGLVAHLEVAAEEPVVLAEVPVGQVVGPHGLLLAC